MIMRNVYHKDTKTNRVRSSSMFCRTRTTLKGKPTSEVRQNLIQACLSASFTTHRTRSALSALRRPLEILHALLEHLDVHVVHVGLFAQAVGERDGQHAAQVLAELLQALENLQFTL